MRRLIGPHRILVGLKTLEESVALTKVACTLGAGSSEVVLVHVIELPEPTPLDVSVPELEAKARRILNAAAALASRSALNATTRLLRARSAAEALIGEITDGRIDVAVIGYHHRRTLTELVLGTTARNILRRAPCYVVCAVPPREKSARRGFAASSSRDRVPRIGARRSATAEPDTFA